MITRGKFSLGLPFSKIGSRLVVGLVGVFLSLSIFAIKSPVSAHYVDCWGHSTAWKSSSTGNFMYKASTQCVEKIFYIAALTIYLQNYDWSQKKWVDVRTLGGGGVYNNNFYSFVTQNGVYVPPYLGINCRRIKTNHGVSHDGINRTFTTYSTSQCF